MVAHASSSRSGLRWTTKVGAVCSSARMLQNHGSSTIKYALKSTKTGAKHVRHDITRHTTLHKTPEWMNNKMLRLQPKRAGSSASPRTAYKRNTKIRWLQTALSEIFLYRERKLCARIKNERANSKKLLLKALLSQRDLENTSETKENNVCFEEITRLGFTNFTNYYWAQEKWVSNQQITRLLRLYARSNDARSNRKLNTIMNAREN